MDSRAQFEEWFMKKHPRSRKGVQKYKDGDYEGEYAQRNWEAWQVSRAAMKQDLPLQHEAKEG